jgi:hypothetical protein
MACLACLASFVCDSVKPGAEVRMDRQLNRSHGRPSPRLSSVVSDSVGLARMILERVLR